MILLRQLNKKYFSSDLLFKINFSNNFINIIKSKFKNVDKFLRLEIKGGMGCGGFQYNFLIDNKYDNKLDEYLKFEEKLYFVIDKDSLEFLKGSKIEYEETMARSGFYVLENPNSEKNCSCKMSFTPKFN